MRLLPKGLGLLLAVEMLRLWPDLYVFYGARSLIEPDLLESWLGSNYGSIAILLQGSSLCYLQAVATLYIICGLLLFADRAVRLTSTLLLLLHYAFFVSDLRLSYGVDYLAQTGLLLCALFYPSDKERPSERAHVGLLLLRFQLCMVYFFGGLHKATGIDWWTGEAIWKAVQQSFDGRLFPIPMEWITYPSLWRILGAAVVITELSYPCIWISQRIRVVILRATIGLHFGIAFTMGLYHFAALMLWYNLCAWHFPYRYLRQVYYLNLKPSFRAFTSTGSERQV